MARPVENMHMIGGISDLPALAHLPDGKVGTDIEMLDLAVMLILKEAVNLEDPLLEPRHVGLVL
ncbi:hypothetical protein V8E54_011298 [Elaphomyces granulatus]